jgi:hypothetical protein
MPPAEPSYDAFDKALSKAGALQSGKSSVDSDDDVDDYVKLAVNANTRQAPRKRLSLGILGCVCGCLIIVAAVVVIIMAVMIPKTVKKKLSVNGKATIKLDKFTIMGEKPNYKITATLVIDKVAPFEIKVNDSALDLWIKDPMTNMTNKVAVIAVPKFDVSPSMPTDVMLTWEDFFIATDTTTLDNIISTDKNNKEKGKMDTTIMPTLKSQGDLHLKPNIWAYVDAPLDRMLGPTKVDWSEA